jgi:hypothetical protein
MYLEISSRQSGKTTRMVDRIIKKAREAADRGEEYRFLVVCVSRRQVDYIRDLIFSQITRRDTPYVVGLFTTYLQYEKFMVGRHHTVDDYYFDEFDFAPQNKSKFFVPDGYYCTTARFIRTRLYLKLYDQERKHDLKRFDLLVELVRKKHHKYKQYVNSRPVVSCKDVEYTDSFFTEKFGFWYATHSPAFAVKKGLGFSPCYTQGLVVNDF